MSMEIIRHGEQHGKKILPFLCLACGCEFQTDEYTTESDHRNGTYKAVACPDCGKQVTRYE